MQFSGLDFWLLFFGFGLLFSVPGSQFPGSGFRVFGFGILASGFRFPGFGFRIRVSGFGFRRVSLAVALHYQECAGERIHQGVVCSVQCVVCSVWCVVCSV